MFSPGPCTWDSLCRNLLPPASPPAPPLWHSCCCSHVTSAGRLPDHPSTITPASFPASRVSVALSSSSPCVVGFLFPLDHRSCLLGYKPIKAGDLLFDVPRAWCLTGAASLVIGLAEKFIHVFSIRCYAKPERSFGPTQCMTWSYTASPPSTVSWSLTVILGGGQDRQLSTSPMGRLRPRALMVSSGAGLGLAAGALMLS